MHLEIVQGETGGYHRMAGLYQVEVTHIVLGPRNIYPIYWIMHISGRETNMCLRLKPYPE